MRAITVTGFTMLSGWPIVGSAALGVAAMIAAILAVAGTGDEGIRLVIRATARTSVLLFTAAFVASALHRAWPGRVSRWMLANRRYLGVSFAVSHLAHLLAILGLGGWSLARVVEVAGLGTVMLGGVAYVFIGAMTATSFDRTAAWLGPGRWAQLHTAGVYYLWAIFFLTFAPGLFKSALYWPFTLALLAALLLRVRDRRSRPAAALAE